MRRRAEIAAATEPTASLRRALDALPEHGEVLDVGVGGGAASLPLAPRAAKVTGVDGSAGMLEAFREAAAAAGVEAVALLGSWPEVEADAPHADVVVCNHVLYNVKDLEPFVRALDAHARHRVVIELTASHPLAWMNDLWERFHALGRPDAPTADDAFDALHELGFDARREDEVRPPRAAGFADRADALSLIRRRLCLPPGNDPELADALGDRLVEHGGLWSAGPGEQPVVTLWWDPVR
jgi:SAM-dependent methyltransferase